MKSGFFQHPIGGVVVAATLLPFYSLVVAHQGQVVTTLAPVLIFVTAMMGLGAWWIFKRDGWLGVLCFWLIYEVYRGYSDPEETGLFVFACVLLVMVRSFTLQDRKLALRCLLWGVGIQMIVVFLQTWGYEPVWNALYGPVGLLGNQGWGACLFALFVPIAPIWLAIPLFIAILFTHSLAGILGASVGVMWMAPRKYRGLVFLLGVLALSYLLVVKGNALPNLEIRLEVWNMALLHLTGWPDNWGWHDVLLGHGFGSWANQIAPLQKLLQVGVLPDKQIQEFYWAHNEYVQFLKEAGLIGFALVCGWIWRWRQAMFLGPYRGAAVSLLIISFWWFPFHIANVAIPASILLGLMTAGKSYA